MSIAHHVSDDLLLAYGAGALDEATSILVATHLALCPPCRAEVALAETIGGVLIDRGETGAAAGGASLQVAAHQAGDIGEPHGPAPSPVALPPSALPPSAQLQSEPRPSALPPSAPQTSAQPSSAPPPSAQPPSAPSPIAPSPTAQLPSSSSPSPPRGPFVLPQPLRGYAGGDACELPWRVMGGGIRQMALKTRGTGATARLLSIGAGKRVPEHGHGGAELTLVLAGALYDRDAWYRRGDVDAADSSVVHRPAAGPEGDCICLAVTDAPLKFGSLIPRLLQPFFGV